VTRIRRRRELARWTNGAFRRLSERASEDSNLQPLSHQTRTALARERVSGRRPPRPHPSTLSSAHPGSVAGLLFKNTMRRVLGKGRLEASARL
jgi:hypothetical protein